MPTTSVQAPPLGRTSGDRRIRVEGLTRRFGETVAVHPLELELGHGPGTAEGTVVGLLGPNGSGKSTLMRMLIGLVPPDAGRATVAGTPLRGDGRAIRQRVTYAPGELHLYDEMRGDEHLRWLLRGRDAAARARAFGLAGEFGLPLRRRVRGYSHGMKRQLLFAAALAPDVGVRVLDEPTDGLDPATRRAVLEVLEEDARRGTTILLSSHHLEEVDRVCERLVFVSEGRLIADQSAAEARQRARRLVRLSWEPGTDLARVEGALDLPGVASVRREGSRVSIVLEGEDPRPLLGALAVRFDLPAPASVEHGRFSLRELYRELYGVEGC